MEGDDFVLRAGGGAHFPYFPRKLQGGFVGFGARVADEGSRGGGHAAGGFCLFDEELGERAGPGVMVEV